MLTSRYMTSVKNVANIMKAIQDGAAPPSFTVRHLSSIGYKATNDRGIIPVLKDLKFLSEEGKPTQRYLAYRDRSQAKAVLGHALKEAYEDLFHVKERPTDADKDAIEGKFKATHNVSDQVAELQARTFFAFLKLADLDAASSSPLAGVAAASKAAAESDEGAVPDPEHRSRHSSLSMGLRYNIEIHLPATKEVEVFNAIFKSLKEHLLDH
jgi:hypothetical protein